MDNKKIVLQMLNYKKIVLLVDWKDTRSMTCRSTMMTLRLGSSHDVFVMHHGFIGSLTCSNSPPWGSYLPGFQLHGTLKVHLFRSMQRESILVLEECVPRIFDIRMHYNVFRLLQQVGNIKTPSTPNDNNHQFRDLQVTHQPKPLSSLHVPQCVPSYYTTTIVVAGLAYPICALATTLF